MYGPDHRASTGGEIKPVSHTNPSALITFTEVMACILSPWKPLVLPVCCLCVSLIFKGKVTGPIAELSAARSRCSPSPAQVLMLHPRDKRWREGSTCLYQAGLFSRARFAGRGALGLWYGGFGVADMGEPKKHLTLSECKHLLTTPVLSRALLSLITSKSWAHFRAARWSWGRPLCLSALGGFDFVHLVAVWIVLITIPFMKDPCFFQRPHSTVLEKAIRGVTYQESQVLEEVNNTWFNRVRKEHKCWLGLWPSIFSLVSRQLFPHHWMECR